MREDLSRWNDGRGIDLRDWVSCMGNYELAVGYASLFWPEFEEFDGYILRKGFGVENLRAWEAQPGITRKGIEWVINHLHIADIHQHDESRLSEDKVVALGNLLKQVYEAKLAWQFPYSPCEVVFDCPEPGGDIVDYQLSFWQRKHEAEAT